MPTSKAQSLLSLQPKLTEFKIPEIEVFDVGVWLTSSDDVLSHLQQRFRNCALAIRSSAWDEDGGTRTRAGEYHSALDVPAGDVDAIRKAIESVIASYNRSGAPATRDEVIVQMMLQNTVMSGVVFTHDLNSGAPYFVINYDDDSGLTNTVTSGGNEYANRTLFIHRDATQQVRSERFQRLLRAIRELELVTSSQFLDIEFAMGQDLTPYLLQVRAITTQPNWNRAVSRRINAALDGIRTFVASRFRPMDGVHGKTTVLGQMPDWNPAEMIGRAPGALAFSFYKTLITDNAWRNARQSMGYAVPSGQPLMVSLAGQPFIDTRLSFHSYLPADLPSGMCQKLVDAWVARLRSRPDLHDKIEFDVAVTTYSFDLDHKLRQAADGVLTDPEREMLTSALRDQTRALLDPAHASSVESALRQVEQLARRQQARSANLLREPGLAMLFPLIDDCIRLGTTPFAILARHAFIAKTLLLSLHRKDILTLDEVQGLQAAIRTIASDLVRDMRQLQLGEIPRVEFMTRYGHLRPGTYDIRSLRYDQMEELGVGAPAVRKVSATSEFVLGSNSKRRIDQLLAAEGFHDFDADRLLEYIAAATAGREYGKFVFSRDVSDMLELIAEFGNTHGLSREEMSHVPLHELFRIAAASDEGSIEDRLRKIATDEAEKHALSMAIRLPQVLFDEAGIFVVPFQVSHPNFITNKKVTAPAVVLQAGDTPTATGGRIVLIEKADPGFDCIFSEQIAGLITKYGGANSHMAIRCAEFGIPAAIGCGEQRFEALTTAHQIMLDCAASLIQPIH